MIWLHYLDFTQGVKIDLSLIINTSKFESIILKSTNYDLFIKLYYNHKDNVFEAEYVTFLHTWLSKVIFCNRLKKVTRPYLDIVVALATGQNVALGPFVLNHIFKGMNDLTFIENDKLSGTTRGLFGWSKSNWPFMPHISLTRKKPFKFLLIPSTGHSLLYLLLPSSLLKNYLLIFMKALF